MKSLFLDHPEYLIVAFAVAFFLLAMWVETGILVLQGKRKLSAGDYATNLTMYAGSLVIDFFWLPIVFLALTWVHQFSLFKIGYQWWLFQGTTPVWHWALLFLLDDLCYYWFHRCSHRFWLLWASHENHHASSYFNLSVAARQTWTPFLAFLFWLPLVLLGFDPLMILTMQLISLTYQSFLHTELIKGSSFLGLIFNTASHHRVHHAAEAPYLDRNFGGTLIIWDRLFGTFTAETSPVRYGTGQLVDGYDPLQAGFSEWGRYLRFLRSPSLVGIWKRFWSRPGGES
jgi:sterol desaturase/sphingolipid hydroxylase (fatty acid hydroxylase superfamily)